MRKLRMFPGILVILSIILSSCGVANDTASVVKVGWTGEPDSLNPGMALLTESFTIFGLIYDTLYELNPDGSYDLSLAESVSVSDDGKMWTFKLRDGVEFSDGEPLTALDVAYSFNFYSKHPDDFAFMSRYTNHFKSVVAKTKQEVVINLTEPIPNMASQLYALYVLPKHIWEKVKDPTETDVPLSQSVGSGPFQLTTYVRGQYIRLQANDNYFNGTPSIRGIEFRIYNDLPSLITDFSDKKVDLITNLPVNAVAALDSMAGARVVAGPPATPLVSDIILNQIDPSNCPVEAGGLCTGHPALRDRAVRLAMAHAIDKQRLIDEVLRGLADPGLTLIPRGLGSFYNSSIQDYGYDVTVANRILDNAGYIDVNNDGVREMPDGSRDLIFRLEWADSNPYARSEAEMLKVMWQQIGIGVVMESVDSDTLTSRCCPTFDYDIILWEWSSDPDPDFLLSIMLTDGIASGLNETGYSNPEYDALYAQQSTQLDGEARRGIIWRMQDIVHDDIVYIIPFYQKIVQAYRTDRFRGWLTDKGTLDLSGRSSMMVVEPIE